MDIVERKETHSDEGPRCPYCSRQYTADDPEYYDEQGYTEETCDECEKTFDVSVFISTSWTCTAREAVKEKE
jgi:transposase-like protein